MRDDIAEANKVISSLKTEIAQRKENERTAYAARDKAKSKYEELLHDASKAAACKENEYLATGFDYCAKVFDDIYENVDQGLLYKLANDVGLPVNRSKFAE